MHFNQININDYANILKIERGILPPIKNQVIDVPGKDGSLFIKNNLGEREINVTLELKGVNRRNVYSKARELLTLLYTEEPSKLWFEDEPDYYYNAILSGETDMTLIYHYGIINLKFMCYDPYIYSKREKIIHYDDNARRKPLNVYNNSPFVLDTVIDFRALDIGGEVYIRNLTNGTQVSSNSRIVTMYMDSAKQLTIINGEIGNHLISFSSSYITLAPGWNTLESNIRTTGSIRYTERRL